MAGLSHRQTEILNIARASGRVMVEDLARRFEVSAQTGEAIAQRVAAIMATPKEIVDETQRVSAGE